MRRLGLLAALGVPCAMVLAPGGCSTAGSICDAICECQLCNDRVADECEIQVNAALDIASSYGCDDESASLSDCVLENNDCDDNRFEVSSKCSDDAEDFADCIQDNSEADFVNIGFVVSIQQPPQEESSGSSGQNGG